MTINPNDLLILNKQPEKKEQIVEETPSATAVSKPEPAVVNESKPETVNEPEVEAAQPSNKAEEKPVKVKKRRGDALKESRNMAKGMKCVWHPWRQAYAICAYCHRAFCFEDIVEEMGNYYCLEDSDKVVKNVYEDSTNAYNYITMISGMLLFLPLVIFFYFDGTVLIEKLLYLQNVGLFTFINNINYSYLPFMYIILTLFAGASGTMILYNKKMSGALGIVSGIMITAAFIYSYSQNTMFYNLFIAIISSISILLLVYSKMRIMSETSYILKERGLEKSRFEWSNTS